METTSGGAGHATTRSSPTAFPPCTRCGSRCGGLANGSHLGRKPLRIAPPRARTPRTACVSTSGAGHEKASVGSKKADSAALLAAAALPLSFDKLNPSKVWKDLKGLRDKIYYGDVLPPVGSQQLSYARFLEMLAEREIKRIVLLSEGRVALVECPVEGYASLYAEATYDRQDDSIMYADELPEPKMEKHRYYVEMPGDLWEDGTFMDLIKMNMAPLRDAEGRVRHRNLLQTDQVHTELSVFDTADAYQWLSQYADQVFPILALVALRMVVGLGDWVLKRVGKQERNPMQELMEEFGAHRAREFNMGVTKQDTGVRYEDVAGIEPIKALIAETMAMMLGDARFDAMGARAPRGILLEGPPGTGKTYLARAMAGEAGLPFFAANGSEFVEMFEGVAAARIRDLFRVARLNSPSIIFIDEVDAIGKARGTGGDDPGTKEREAGLLQLLAEMDGVRRNDRVLVLGATNRVNALDDALLRPGRFDRTIYMGRPSTANRFKILQVHARGRPISSAGNARWPEHALLHEVAELSIGYSGAELANLLNEASILMVRKSASEIDMGMIREVMDKRAMGLTMGFLPPSPAKHRLATLQAARAVAACLTPGLPPVLHASIRPRGSTLARIIFLPQEFGQYGDDWHRLYAVGKKVNAVQPGLPLTTLEMLCGLLVPLYVPRVAEEVIFGPEDVTLSTSSEVARAGDLADWLVRKSTLHPAYRDLPVLYGQPVGGEDDPTTAGLEVQFEAHTLALQAAAKRRATRLVKERQAVIEQVARELQDPNNDESVQGSRIVELLETLPLSPVDPGLGAAGDAAPGHNRVAARAGVAGFAPGGCGTAAFNPDDDADEAAAWRGVDLGDEALAAAAEVVMGRADLQELTASSVPRVKALELRRALQSPNMLDRLRAVQRFRNEGGDFPPPPSMDDLAYKGNMLEDWTDPEGDVVEVC